MNFLPECLHTPEPIQLVRDTQSHTTLVLYPTKSLLNYYSE